MDFLERNYRYFLMVAEKGSITLAAKALRIGQPAVSVAMMQLESILNVKLFNREGRRLVLNDQGIQLVQALQKGQRFLSNEVSHIFSEAKQQPIRFGVVSHWALKSVISLLPEIEQRFGPIQAHFGYSLNIFEQVRSGELNLGIVSWSIREPRWKNKILLHEDREAIVGLKSKFSFLKDAKSIEDLNKERWIWHRMPQKNMRDYLDPNTVGVVVDNYELLKKLLFSGWGIAAVQLDSFSKKELKNLVQASFSPHLSGEKTKLYLLYNEGLSDRHLNLIKFLKEAVKIALEL